MTSSDARTSLPALIDLVQGGDEVTITRHGQPVAVLVHPDALRRRRAEGLLTAASRIHDMIALPDAAAASEAPAGLTVERAEELIAAVRSGRDAR